MKKSLFCFFFLCGCAHTSQFEMNGDSPFWIELGSYNHSDMSFSISTTIKTKFKYRNKDYSKMLESELVDFAYKFCGDNKPEFLNSDLKKTISIASHQETEYPYHSKLTKVLICK